MSNVGEVEIIVEVEDTATKEVTTTVIDVVDEKDALFSKKHDDILEDAIDIRMGIVKGITKQGLENLSARDARLINELLTGTEGTIFGKVDRKLKKKENTDAQNNADAVIAILRELGSASGKQLVKDMVIDRDGKIRPDVLPEDFTNVQVVDGELDVNPDHLNKDDFLIPSKIIVED